tara:strand:- start:2395 stop:2667 length:273 start_codon:yes stop_codon:yes gene_type:complete
MTKLEKLEAALDAARDAMDEDKLGDSVTDREDAHIAYLDAYYAYEAEVEKLRATHEAELKKTKVALTQIFIGIILGVVLITPFLLSTLLR